MFVLWYKANGNWYKVETFMLESYKLLKDALIKHGYEVSEAPDTRK